MPLPKPKLDDKEFQQLVDEAKRLIPIHTPEWTDYNVHDPGITFIELFAWLMEMQIYHLDQITEKNLLKFLKIMGEKPRPAIPASAYVTFLHDSVNSINVPLGTQVAAIDSLTGEKIIFETTEDINVISDSIEIISQDGTKFTDNTLANELEGHFYYAFGENDENDNALYIGFENSLDSSKINLMVYLYEDNLLEQFSHGNELNVYPSAEVEWEYGTSSSTSNGEWKPLNVSDNTRSLTFSGVISFQVPSDLVKRPINSNEKYWIRCRIVEKGFEISPRIDSILLNAVNVLQIETIEETLGQNDGLADHRFALSKQPVLEDNVKVYVNNVQWIKKSDFDVSKYNDPHYVFDPEKGEILFGDGIKGKIPSSDAVIEVNYSHLVNEKGNVKEGSINQIVENGFENLQVVNYKAASGGSRRETVLEAIQRVRKDLTVPYTAVTSKDYEYLTLNTPGLRVKRAKAIPNPEENQVKVIVIPDIFPQTKKPIASNGFLKTVYSHLYKHRLITTEVIVEKPKYVEITVHATLKTKPGYESELLKQRAEKKLNEFINPLTGGRDGQGWPFGRNVFPSEIYEVLDEVEGVDCVDQVNLNFGTDFNENEIIQKINGEIRIPPEAVVWSQTHDLAVLRSDESCRRGKSV